ncbi:MAG: hypothetical protein MMC23_006887 [Stictis urceolatum]|nr:hypothetical protein [Stictis urceolata]
MDIPPVPTFPEKRSDSPASSLSGIRMPFDTPHEEHAPADPPFPEAPIDLQIEQPLPETASLRRRPSQGAVHFRKPSVSAATRPLHEIGSMRTHRSTASRGASPNKLEVESVEQRSGSAQSERSDRRLFDAPPVPGVSTAHVEGYEIPRSQSAGGMRPERRAYEEMPPLPIQIPASGFDVASNPYHTPSESLSSNESARQTSSSRSSPPTSASSFVPSRKQSDAGEARLLDNFNTPVPMPAPLQIPVPPPSSSPMSAPVSNSIMQFPQPPVPAGPVSAPPINNPQPFQQSQQQPPQPQPQPRRRPAKSFSRPNYVYQPDPAPLQQPPESPLDPAMQNGRLPPLITYDRFSPPQPPIQSPQSAPVYHQAPTLPQIPPSPGFLPPQRHVTAPSPARRATTGNKGSCRGCGDPIKGKSVSSADGRLTGRWHKHCFVCETCREPFQTMDFYVLGNRPYCSRHYHELNRSMCTKCDRGIEGHYVETDRQLKFHPHCFTCQDCHLILRDNYFEAGGGKILCEQHAFRSNHLLGPGRCVPEKRSTRLMMMMM